MTTITRIIPETKAKYITILPLADFHIGDRQADIQLIHKLIDRIKTDRNCYCILNGDLMNNAVIHSVSDTYNETYTPMEQIAACVRLFGPIKNKIICVTGGNHEARTWKQSGLDMTRLFCRQLGIEDRYTETTALVFLKTGRKTKQHRNQQHTYTIYVTHGSGGGRKPGGKINRLVDYSGIVDSDIVICSHTHQPAVIRQKFFRPDVRNNAIVTVDRLFVNTAAAMNYGGYGDIQGYTPASTKYPEIKLYNDEKIAEAIL